LIGYPQVCVDSALPSAAFVAHIHPVIPNLILLTAPVSLGRERKALQPAGAGGDIKHIGTLSPNSEARHQPNLFY
jgi:hypothetical protein